MRKIIIVSFSLLFLPLISLATSGACSGHGGVDCHAGSDYDGSIVCADGWRDSAVLFSNMAMCKTNLIPTCYLPTKQDFHCEQVSALATLSGLSGSSSDQTPQCKENQKQADLQYQKDYETYKKCFSNIGYNVDTGQIILPTKLTQDEKCRKQYSDPNAKAIGNNCGCNEGYTLYNKNGVCEPTKTTAPKIQETPIVEPLKQDIIPIEVTKPTNQSTKSTKKIVTLVKKEEAKPFLDILKQPSEEVVNPPVIEEPKIEQVKPIEKKTFWQKFRDFWGV